MCVLLSVCAILLSTYSTSAALLPSQVQRESSDRKTDIQDVTSLTKIHENFVPHQGLYDVSSDFGYDGLSARKRRKRGINLLARALYRRGMKATEFLLKGTNPIFITRNDRLYEKTGGYVDALKDFQAVGPTNVENFGTQRWGKVGNRKIAVRPSDGTGAPSLTIYTPGKIPDDYAEVIADIILYIE